MEATHGANVFGLDVIDRLDLVQSSLVNTLPKTNKDKYTAVTEAHKECT